MLQDEVLVLALKIDTEARLRGRGRAGKGAAVACFINFSTLKMLFIFHGERKIEEPNKKAK